MGQRQGFSQIITIRTDDPETLVRLAAEWDELQATLDVMGYAGSHVLADREDPGRYLIVAEFAAVEPGVTAYEEALKNNDRPETQDWARKLLDLVEGEPEWSHFDELYRTDI
jgi:hypothetical protein